MSRSMTVEYEPPLATALAALLAERRLTVAQVARAAGFSRTTVAYILSGKTRHPPIATIRRLAVALATDPKTREVERPAVARIERILTVAGGYADPIGGEARTLTELGLYHELNSLERARAWVEGIAECRDLWPDEIRALFESARRLR